MRECAESTLLFAISIAKNGENISSKVFLYVFLLSSPFVKTIRRKVSFSLGVLTQNGMKYYFKKYIGLVAEHISSRTSNL